MKVLLIILSVELLSVCLGRNIDAQLWSADNNGQGYGDTAAVSKGYGNKGASNVYGSTDNGVSNGYGVPSGYGDNGNGNAPTPWNSQPNGYGDNGNRASSGYGSNGNKAPNGYGANNGANNGYGGSNGYTAPAEPCTHPGKLRGATGSLVYEECVPAGPGFYVWLARRCAPGTAFDPWEGNCSAIDPNFTAEAWKWD